MTTVESRTCGLTATGIHLTVVGLLTGFAAIVLANNLLFLVFGVIAGLFVVSAIAAGTTVRRISLVRHLPHPLFAQQRFRARLEVRNSHPFWPAYHLELSEQDVGRGATRHTFRTFLAKAPARGAAEATYAARLPESGWVSFPSVRVTTVFPFGLLRWSREIPLDASVLVLPRLGRISPRFFQEKYSPSPAAAFAGLGRRGDDEFAGLHEYRPGEDARLIHWKSSARLRDRQMVRELENVSLARVVIALDLRVIARRDRLRQRLIESMVSFTATLAADLVAKGHCVAVWAFLPELEEHEARPGDGSLHGLFEGLALLDPRAPGRVEEHLDRAGPHFFLQNQVILVGRGAQRLCSGRHWADSVVAVDPGTPKFSAFFRKAG